MRGEEEKDGDVKRGAGDLKFFIDDRFDRPGGGDEDSDKVNKQHFVELKNFGGKWPENERGDEKQDIKKLTDDFGQIFVGVGHGFSLAFWI